MAGGRGWLERLGLKKRLALMTFLVAVFAAVMATGMLGTYSSRALFDESANARAQLADFTASSIAERLQSAVRACNLTLSQEPVATAVARAADGASYSVADQIHDAWEMADYFIRLQSFSNFWRVRLFLGGPTIYTNENVSFFLMDAAQREQLALLRRQGRFYTVSEGERAYLFRQTRRVVTVLHSKESPGDFLDVCGAVAIDIDTEDILSRMRKMLVSEGDAVTLYDREGRAVLSVGDRALAALPPAGRGAGVWSRAPGSGAHMYERPLEVDGWLLSYRVPAGAMSGSTAGLFRAAGLALLGVLLLSFAMTLTASAANSRRLLTLAAAMDRVRSGDMDARVEEGGASEVGLMERSFNYLVDELRAMVDSKVKDERERQTLEMRLLESQIKPHFLYNTLDLICWRLNTAGDANGARYVQALAQFYRIGLSRGPGLIPLSEELRHVQLYVEIQNFRLDGAVSLEISLPHDCAGLPVPGNILQPLVENSIGAGILERADGRGSVRVACEKAGGMLTILVSDDGVGADIAAIEELLRGGSDAHYGVWNVHRRLRLLLGEEAGLSYSRNARGGVDALMRIPLRPDPGAPDA